MDDLIAVLGEDYSLVDYEDFWQILNARGEHVGLVTPDWYVQLDLSAILMGDLDDEEAMYALAEAADDMLRAEVAPTFVEVGFQVSEEGHLQAAEAEEGDETIVSFELPVLTQAEDAAMVRQVLDWVATVQREFFLFTTDGPLVPAMPVEDAD
ncbi:MAG: hypothetical protein EP330_21055 [Deltaproteobacteria bacterium]|nr:MAG: hypothetical protein EP330_21055 [Deltaproteobacteria bacterium]